MSLPLVSTIIPTFNRRDLVCRAIDSALAQTYLNQEIIVIDDGSTDGTREELQRRYGDRLRCISQANGGVSQARNHGMKLARGDFIALLDSDDRWRTDKLARQVEFLQSHPELSMVLTDVQRVDGSSQPIDMFHRRSVIPADGNVLSSVLMNPALVPASVLLRRSVLIATGGFDESLPTAEDIEFHLRVAARFGIGVIDEPMTIAMRGHEGLSQDPQSDSNYVRVIEQFVATHASQISRHVRRRCLFETYARNCHSAAVSRRLWRSWGYWMKGAANASSGSDLRALAVLTSTWGRVALVSAARSIGLRRSASPARS